MKKTKCFAVNLLVISLLSISTQLVSAQNYNYYNNSRPQLQGKISIIPIGTTLSGITTSEISSATMVVGDSVVLTLNAPFYYRGTPVAPANSNIIGIVTKADKAGRAANTGTIKIKFNEIITPDGRRIPISAKVVTNDGKGVLMGQATKEKTKDISKNLAIGAAGGALTGVIFGPISGGKVGKGAALGTAVGAGLGLGKTLLDKGNDVSIPAGSRIDIMIDQPVTVNY